MMNTKKMKTVVVGCGDMSKTWVKEALAAEQVEVVGLVDLDPDMARAMAERYDLPAGVAFGSLAEAVKATEAEAVFDVTIPAAHAAVTSEALGLGCHVLGEKPMSDSMESAKKMVAAAAAANRVYAVTQTKRPLVAPKSIEAFLAAGELGPPVELHTDFYLGCHFGGFRDAMAHPLILDMAIHTFDNARQLSGADPVSVYCESWNPKQSWYAAGGSAVAIFEMTDGIRYTYRGSWCNEGRHTSWGGNWRIVGTNGTVTWDGDDRIDAERVKPGGQEGFHRELETVDVPLVELEHTGHAYLIRQFADHVLSGGKTPLECPAADNVHSLAMVLGAVESVETGRRVAVSS